MGKSNKRSKVDKTASSSSSSSAAGSSVNQYDGCVSLPQLAVIKKADYPTPKAFFDQYIASRTPVLFDCTLTDSQWQVSAEKWSNAYLRAHTPKKMKVKVEHRQDTTHDSFGHGEEQFMTFHSFLDKMDRKEEHWYLTTQELEYDFEGQPYILTKPLTSFANEFPTTPSLFESLVIFNINLWYGLTKTFATSGLHHDFHDNLYILLKGEKQVTLYSPAYALQLYTEGKIAQIHPNGRVNYEGQLTEADGRDVGADKALDAAKKLQLAAQKLEENAEDAEDELDQALETALDAEFGGEDDFDDDDDDDDEEDDFEGEDDDDDKDEDDDEDFGNLEDMVAEELRDDEDDDEDEEEEEKEAQASSSRKRKAPVQEKKDDSRPKSFSQVNTALPMEELKEKFPQFAEVHKHAITVTVKAGQMLYIPCGWFHEVQSKGEDGHVAFNYWFHPPDQKDFAQPYSSPFWKEINEKRRLQKL